MEIFRYTALDPNGNKISGEQEANSKDAVARYLHDQKYVVVNIEEKVDFLGELLSDGIPKVSLKNRVIFAKQLSTMLSAGLAITQALEIVVQQTSDKALEKNLQAVLNDIQKNGVPLSDAMERHTKLFNTVQISLIRAGEASGNLVEVLEKVAQDLDKTKKIKSKIQNAMIYPIIVFLVIGVVMIVMMTTMIPAVEELYRDFNIDKLPAVTAILVAISNFITKPYGYGSLILGFAIFIFVYRYYRGTASGRLATDKYILKIPVFGNLIAKIQIAEFCRLTSMLLRSGIPIVEALNIVSDALSNILFKNSVLQSIDDITKGIPLAVPLSKSEVFPPLIVRMVAIGEETGKLDQVLADMAIFYDDEVEEISENLNKLMEPMILVIVGGIVAFLAVGIYLPIYSIGQNMS
jgi:type IV pilus assembly protein PilC